MDEQTTTAHELTTADEVTTASEETTAEATGAPAKPKRTRKQS